jgi:hypothetical protein
MNTEYNAHTPEEQPEDVLIGDDLLRDLAVEIAARSTIEQLHYLVHLFLGVAAERKKTRSFTV